MTRRIFFKLLVGVLSLLLLAAVSVDYFATEVAKTTYIQNLTAQLAQKGRMLAVTLNDSAGLTPERARAIEKAAAGRITVMRADGTVLADSEANAAGMENHRSRPEFVRALGGQTGTDVRLSATLGTPFLYVAVPFSEGAIRVAVPLSEVDRQTAVLRWKILGSTALAFLPALIVAALLARYLSRRFSKITGYAAELARGNYRARLDGADASEFGHLIGTLNDTAANLEREHAELEKVERIRKDFVINVSHELRTPLASIQGYTETLLDGAMDDPAYNRRFLGIIRHNAERLARITEDLLTLSRLEQKRRTFEFDSHPVNAMLRDAVDLMRPLAEKRQIRIEMEPGPEEAVAVCDAEAVSQVLSNLLDNAIKYSHAGGRVAVGARIAGEAVEIFVRDTGIGIPAEDLPRLFERFYRVDKARSRQMGGTGLGLAIVKHLVGAQNGAARVESRVGEGSTFYFTLPLDRAPLLNPEFTTP